MDLPRPSARALGFLCRLTLRERSGPTLPRPATVLQQLLQLGNASVAGRQRLGQLTHPASRRTTTVCKLANAAASLLGEGSRVGIPNGTRGPRQVVDPAIQVHFACMRNRQTGSSRLGPTISRLRRDISSLIRRSLKDPVQKSGSMDSESLVWSVDHLSHFRGHLYVDGWAFHPRYRVRSISVQLPGGKLIKARGYGLASPDIATHHGDRAKRCRFSLRVAVPNADDARQASLVFRMSRGPAALAENLNRNLGADPFNQLYLQFHEMVRSLGAPTIVEVGSRARSGNVHVGWLPKDATYSGFDVVDGPNVDVVGDAHKISDYFPSSSVDAIFSLSTIEHLAMPWKAVVEMNSILKIDGLVFVGTHQTWPVHDEPWDFWRFSSYTWRTLFNEATGFEIVDVAMGERASVVADFLTPSTAGLDLQPAFLGSSVIARKIGSTGLDWDVDLRMTTDADYPA